MEKATAAPNNREDAVIPNFRNSHKISLIIPSIVSLYSHDILSGVSDFCSSHHLELAIHISDDKIDKESYLLRTVPLTDTKGIILFPGDNNSP
jgi:DNA-binding LacI/PurR family transcriptional regulator